MSFPLLSTASRKTNYHRRPGIEKASRANLLWGLILARNTAYRKNFLTKHSHETKQQHQNHSYKRQQRLHLNNANEDVYSVPLNVGMIAKNIPWVLGILALSESKVVGDLVLSENSLLFKCKSCCCALEWYSASLPVEGWFAKRTSNCQETLLTIPSSQVHAR